MTNEKCATGTQLNTGSFDLIKLCTVKTQTGNQLQAPPLQEKTIQKALTTSLSLTYAGQKPSISTKHHDNEAITRFRIKANRNEIFQEESTIRRLKKASPSRLLRLARLREILADDLAELRQMNLLDTPADTVLFILNNNKNGISTDDLRAVLRCEDIIWARHVLVREKRITATADGSTYILKPIAPETKKAA